MLTLAHPRSGEASRVGSLLGYWKSLAKGPALRAWVWLGPASDRFALLGAAQGVAPYGRGYLTCCYQLAACRTASRVCAQVSAGKIAWR
ncbi:MAG: hypothetical protein AMXMBFR56_65640 [Polyangiaceae bacterium]